MEAAALSADNATTNVGNATISASTPTQNTSNTTATSKDDDVQLVVATTNEDAESSDNDVVEVSSKEPARKKKKVAAVITEIVWSELEAELWEGEKQHREKVIAGDAQPREEDNLFDFTSLGLPKQLKVSTPNGTSPTWDFYLCLDVKVVDYIQPKTNKGGGGDGIRAHFPSVKVRKPFTAHFPSVKVRKPFTHICRLCLEDLKTTSPTVVSFKRALRNIQNVGNGEKHLTTKHSEDAKVVRYLEEKLNKKNSKGALDSGITTTTTTSTPASRNAMTQALRKRKDETTRELTATWLINNHLAHHTTQSLEFKALMTHLDPEFKSIGRDAFLKILNQQTQFSLGASQLRSVVTSAARRRRQEEDKSSLDLNGIVWMEHINFIVGPSKEMAESFYLDVLGCTRDTGKSFHVNLGQQQFHLACCNKQEDEKPQRIAGSVGLAVPSINSLLERIHKAQENGMFSNTQFQILANDDDSADNDNGGNCLAISCPWGNIFYCYDISMDDQWALTAPKQTPRKMENLHSEGGAYGSHRMAVRGQAGIRFVEIACPPHKVPAVARFYKEMLGCDVWETTAENNNAPIALVSVGPGVHLVFVETTTTAVKDGYYQEEASAMKGVHICFLRTTFKDCTIGYPANI